ncbi:helix-turn-helix domain-containing protein [Streptomyces buecherae]|uniref:Helix-turn-helix domain-containing protein n=1 Tax=Streptomyces buecherae TaxID=2763006 RepID=A0A7H8NB61_9ACTN|nr:helix-turn-helix transcriptional regulator [Streptomyces buecherae]QKW51705.1 helix-turn-helix domain-containing protein [Streptomyces buecherae]
MRVFEFWNKNGDESVSESGTPYAKGTPFGDLLRKRRAEQGLSYRALAQRAVDPESGTVVGYTTLHRIAQDKPIMVDPGVVGAVAAALDLPERDVRIAAAAQYCGLVADDPFDASADESTVVVVHAPGMGREDMPKVEALLRRYAAGELPDELTEGERVES